MTLGFFKSTSRGLQTSALRSGVFNNVLGTIGRTPTVKANKMLSEAARSRGSELFVKCEFTNPASSVKDRLALALILDYEKRGMLKHGDTIVEATSGNTGIALAMVCAQRGYHFVATMTDKFSIERRKAMRALGAKVVLTRGEDGAFGMTAKAKELSSTHGWLWARQFEAEANPRFHANTTGPEILLDFYDRPLDYFVAGYGTGGTFRGVATVLKAARPETKTILIEPSAAPLLSSGVPQEREEDKAPLCNHPKFTPHPMQGLTPSFIPWVIQKAFNEGLVDDIRLVEAEEALNSSRRLARLEGIYSGISAGANVAAATKLVEESTTPVTALTVVPDTMDRYMSTVLMEAIPAEMGPEEVAISKSTPSFQYPSTG